MSKIKLHHSTAHCENCGVELFGIFPVNVEETAQGFKVLDELEPCDCGQEVLYLRDRGDRDYAVL